MFDDKIRNLILIFTCFITSTFAHVYITHWVGVEYGLWAKIISVFIIMGVFAFALYLVLLNIVQKAIAKQGKTEIKPKSWMALMSFALIALSNSFEMYFREPYWQWILFIVLMSGLVTFLTYADINRWIKKSLEGESIL